MVTVRVQEKENWVIRSGDLEGYILFPILLQKNAVLEILGSQYFSVAAFGFSFSLYDLDEPLWHISSLFFFFTFC